MTKDLRAALIGYGYAGRTIHAPLIRAAKGLTLASVVSSRPRDVLADLPDVDVAGDLDVVIARPDIDLVVIATPNSLHAPQAHAALEAGKHVAIDKPFALSVAEGQALIDHAARAGRTLSVFHCRRWDSNFLALKALRPRLGDLHQVILRFDRWRPTVRDRWRERAGAGSGLWFDLGSHMLDQALCLFGRPEWIEADIAAQRPGARTDDYFHVALGYGPLRVILHASMLTCGEAPSLEAQGSRGGLIKFGMDTQEAMLKAGRLPGSPGFGEDPIRAKLFLAPGDTVGDPEETPSPPGEYLAYYEALARALRGDGPNPVTAEDALEVMALLELGFASAREGRRLWRSSR